MARMFDIGDRVVVHMGNNSAFGCRNFEAVINWMPSDTGDCFHLTGELETSSLALVKKEIMLNPISSEFIGFSKIKEPENG
jgi:hypothetical protein